MLELTLFISLGILILILFELRARKQSNSEALKQRSAQTGEAAQTSDGGECCGQHLVCEKETLEAIARGEMKKCDPVEACQRKRDIVWTSLESYRPEDPMPEWIKSRFPMPGEDKRP